MAGQITALTFRTAVTTDMSRRDTLAWAATVVVWRVYDIRSALWKDRALLIYLASTGTSQQHIEHQKTFRGGGCDSRQAATAHSPYCETYMNDRLHPYISMHRWAGGGSATHPIASRAAYDLTLHTG